jgi:LacI family transcriptional regulator
MRITIGELAKIAGVSKTTVSRVINLKPDVDPETRQKILHLIEEYDFHPNAFAKAISSKKSSYVGLIVPHEAAYIFSNPFYTEVMRGVSTEIDQRGYYMVICYAHEANYLDIYKQKRVDGFILLSPGSFHKQIIDTLNQESVPYVSTAKISEEDHMTYVDVDNFYGATLVVEHLIGLGHRKIAYLGKPTLQSSLDRMNGYKAAMQRFDCPCCDQYMMITDTSSVQGGYDYTRKLMELPERPTAIFLANDMMAIGAMRAVQDLGLRVPEDVSVVGYDDIPLASYVQPQLTTVRQPAFEKGILAARSLIDSLETGDSPKSTILSVELIARQSTARCIESLPEMNS